jgi:hypothetical protein
MVAWDVALDDVLTERLRACTDCGRPVERRMWFCVFETATAAIATLRCSRCRMADPDGRALQARLSHRYGGPGRLSKEY